MASLPLTSTFFPPSFRTTTSSPSKPMKLGMRKTVSCKSTSDDQGRHDHDHDHQQSTTPTGGKFDRRGVLVGLGGLYGMAGMSGPFASAAPIQAPDLTKCHFPDDLPQKAKVNSCCPPFSKSVDYTPAKHLPRKQRVRLAAHELDDEYIAKYKKAMELMRALPDDDPRSFKQQADVHCAYCNGAYDQIGFPDINIQVHSCWLFFPFHRWQLYFYERILGHLIDDPTFALPFWNWDHPDGMRMPPIYADPTSSLYSKNRNPNHQPPVVVDLDYTKADAGNIPLPDARQIGHNLKIMYRQVVTNTTPELFCGKPYRAGDEPNPGVGALERMPHNNLHVWGGNPANPNNEDLGNFYSSGRDPLFYSLHANVDRMWSVWKTLPGRKRNDFTDSDWLEATFLFYDENAELVRVKVKDAVDTRILGYTYQNRPLPWLKARPISKKKAKLTKGASQDLLVPAARAEDKILTLLTAFPLTLDKAISTVVPRPKKRRSKQEKEDAEEVLVIQGVEYEKSLGVSFSVYVNDEDQITQISPDNSEFAGSFTSVPTGRKDGKKEKTKTDVSLPITELLEDLDAEDDDAVVVTLVPRSGVGKVKIDGIKIELF